jgi:hypothetical protein
VQAGLDRLAVGLAEHELDRLLVGLDPEEAGGEPDHHGRQHDQDDALVGAEAARNQVLEPLLAPADDVFHVGWTASAERTTAAAAIAATAAAPWTAAAATAATTATAAPRAAAVIIPRHRSPQGPLADCLGALSLLLSGRAAYM